MTIKYFSVIFDMLMRCINTYSSKKEYVYSQKQASENKFDRRRVGSFRVMAKRFSDLKC